MKFRVASALYAFALTVTLFGSAQAQTLKPKAAPVIILTCTP